MNDKLHQGETSPADRRPAAGKPARPVATKKKPLRKLFEPEAKPLDSGAPMLARIRPRRRGLRLWAAAGLFCFSLAQGLPQSSGEPIPALTNAPASTNPNPTLVSADTNSLVAADAARGTNDGEPAVDASLLSTALAGANLTSPKTNGDLPANTLTQTVATARPEPNASQPRTSAPVRPQASTPSARNASRSAKLDYSAFRILNERNIFDPNRSPRRAGGSPQARPKTVESFALVGVMAYNKGIFAFFDGTGSQFRKALKASDSIAGFKVTEIEPNSVKLSSAKKEVEVQIGMQMRREEGGEWQLSTRPAETYGAGNSGNTATVAPAASSSSPAAASVPAASTGSADEVLKRLMQRREQE